MSKPPSSAKSIFLRFLHHHHHSKPPISSPISQFISRNPNLNPRTPSLSRFPLHSSQKQHVLTETNLSRSFLGFRYISTKGSNLDVNSFKSKIKEPATAITKAFSRYKQAVGLQMEAFWRRNSMVLLGAGGVLVCILLWRVMFGIANTFIGFSEGMAKYGFLALSSAIVAFAVSFFFHILYVVVADC